MAYPRTVVLEKDRIVAAETIALTGLSLSGIVHWVDSHADLDKLVNRFSPDRLILGRANDNQPSFEWAYRARNQRKIPDNTRVAIFTRDQDLIQSWHQYMVNAEVGVFQKLRVADMLLWMAKTEAQGLGFTHYDEIYDYRSGAHTLSSFGRKLNELLISSQYRPDLQFDEMSQLGYAPWRYRSTDPVISAVESVGLLSNMFARRKSVEAIWNTSTHELGRITHELKRQRSIGPERR